MCLREAFPPLSVVQAYGDILPGVFLAKPKWWTLLSCQISLLALDLVWHVGTSALARFCCSSDGWLTDRQQKASLLVDCWGGRSQRTITRTELLEQQQSSIPFHDLQKAPHTSRSLRGLSPKRGSPDRNSKNGSVCVPAHWEAQNHALFEAESFSP